VKKYAVLKIEKEKGKPLKEILDEYESKKTPIRVVAQELGVSQASINIWRNKFDYPLRKHFGEKNDIQSGTVL
jgi:hypothetical protein